MERLLSLVGLAALVAVAWAMSTNRRGVSWRPVVWGLGLQLVIALVVFSPAVGEFLFDITNIGVKKLLSFAETGADFVFGTIQGHEITTVDPVTGVKTVTVFKNQAVSPPMRNVAFWILPTVIFFSALMAVAYHYRLIQHIVRWMAWLMSKTLGTSGAESLSAAANIFVGQTEAPLVIRPYVDTMTLSELNAIMVGGFATIAGGVLALYVGFLDSTLPGIAGHLVTASFMSAPAALAIAKIMVPEDGVPATLGKVEYEVEKVDLNGIDALSRGTLEGLKLFLNIMAMLLVFVAVIAMLNALLGWVGGWFGWELSLEGVLGWIFAPFAFLLGIPWDEALAVGTLMGEKLVLTELIAFGDLAKMQLGLEGMTPLSERSAVITSYALCGFANFASIGIQIGGIGGIAPGRRGDLARLGVRAMIGGTLAAMMTGGVAGLLYGLF